MAVTRAALYCRLSKDDMLEGESESIRTQKAMLMQYAQEHDFLAVETYIDDGWSGLNFDRPSFNRMLDDIENGKIDVVITKDLSRLGRDHLKVGYFTEVFFPSKDIRYIAVNDMVDTAKSNNDIAAIKNVMNEFYSRDNSRKIRSSIKARAKEGLYRSSFNPLGYRKDPENHNKLIVDDETAWIVKRIFELACKGSGPHKIANMFRDEKVPTPSWWLYSRGEKDYSKRFENPDKKYEWSHTVIRTMISNPVYLGHTAMGKTETIFKVGKAKTIPQEDWILVENTHDPLITQEEFDLANENIASRRKKTKEGTPSIFAGLLKCGDCGKAMNQRYYTKKHRYKIFVCGTYAENRECPQHKIFYDDLYNAVLNDIRYHARLAFEDKEAAIALAEKMIDTNEKSEMGEMQRQLKQSKKRLAEIERLIDRLYEDSVSGRISENNFNRMIEKYQNEQDSLKTTIQDIESRLTDIEVRSVNSAKWADMMEEFVGLDELTAPILNRLISKIEVFERVEDGGETRQEIKIHYRFGGYINECFFAAKMLKRGGHKM